MQTTKECGLWASGLVKCTLCHYVLLETSILDLLSQDHEKAWEGRERVVGLPDRGEHMPGPKRH